MENREFLERTRENNAARLRNSVGAAVFCSPGASRYLQDGILVVSHAISFLGLLGDRQNKIEIPMRECNLTILTEEIENLGLSLEFKQAAQMQGFKSLNDLVHLRTADLEKKPGFNILLIHEYVNFMESAGFGSLIDPRLV